MKPVSIRDKLIRVIALILVVLFIPGTGVAAAIDYGGNDDGDHAACEEESCECLLFCEYCESDPCECPVACEDCGEDPCECPDDTGSSAPAVVSNTNSMSILEATVNLLAAADNKRVTLNWTASSSEITIDHYQYRQRTGNGEWSSWKALPGSGTSHAILSLTNGRSYGFQVRGVDTSGNAVESNIADATPRTVPSAVTNLKASAGKGQVTLKWKAPKDGGSPITGYQYRQRVGSGSWSGWITLEGSGVSRIVTGLTNGKKYRFEVRALNDAGNAKKSNTTASVTPRTAPAAIKNLKVTSGNTQVTLKWKAPNNGGSSITGYQYRQRTNNGKWGSWKTLQGSGTSRTVTGLTNGRMYGFQVRAVNAAGKAPASNTATVTVIDPRLSAYAAEVLRLVNSERRKKGLCKLSAKDTLLNSAAMTRANEITRRWSHTRPNGKDPFTAYTGIGGQMGSMGENIAYGQTSPAAVVRAWMNSPGHRANILGSNYTHLGVGVFELNGVLYWAQLFYGSGFG